MKEINRLEPALQVSEATLLDVPGTEDNEYSIFASRD